MAQMEHSWRAHDYKAAGSASPNGPLPMFKAYLHLPATMLQPPSGAPLNAFSIRYTNFFDPLPVPPIGEHYNSPDYRTQERVLRCWFRYSKLAPFGTLIWPHLEGRSKSHSRKVPGMEVPAWIGGPKWNCLKISEGSTNLEEGRFVT